MRYSKKIAYLAHITIVMSWIALMLTSDFWIEYRSFAVGWLLAYIVLPMYYFKLVEQLHANVDALHEVVYDSKIKAVHDHLTGIYNRTMFEEDFHTLLEDAQLKKEQFALFFIDLDGFKEINDTYGHDQGDKVLIETARRLMCVVEKTYRLGGDEFVCIVPFKTKEEVEKIAQEMMHYLRLPCQESDIKLSASVGISTFPKDATTAFDLKKQADQAMYQAKESGKNKYCFFDEMKTKKCESI
jgi:diguanylate cyclase (GGDEF)-like protein